MSESLGPDRSGESQPSSPPPAPAAPDPQSFARMLIAHLGERATSYAIHQALKSRQRDDQRNAERWLWIAGLIREILRSEPNDAGEPA